MTNYSGHCAIHNGSCGKSLYCRGIFLTLSISLIVLSAPLCAHADDPLAAWTQVSPLEFSDVAHGNEGFLLVDRHGAIFTSSDGTAWTRQESGTSKELRGAACGPDRMVAVGTSKTILLSFDGKTWNQQEQIPGGPAYFSLNAVAYGNGIFVAVGESLQSGAGVTLTSPDGEAWTYYSPNASYLRDIIYSSTLGLFVAVGDAGTIVSSPDGVTWTQRNTGTSHTLLGIAEDNGTFIAVGDAGTILGALDGGVDQWRQKAYSTADAFYSVTCGAGLFIAVGYDWVSNRGHIIVSAGGEVWTKTETTAADGTSLAGIACGSGRFVAVGGEEGTILASEDGAEWSRTQKGVDGWFTAIVCGNNGTLVAVGHEGKIVVSSDELIWEDRASGTSETLLDIAYGNGRFVAVGTAGIILTSPEGNQWTIRSEDVFYMLNGVTYGQDSFIAVGNGGTVIASSDGRLWEERVSGTEEDLLDVVFGGDLYVAVGMLGAIYTSPDGLTWTKIESGISTTLHSITWDRGLFVAVGDTGTILTSSDGETWHQHTSGFSSALRAVTSSGGRFVAVGDDGVMLTSADGAEWTPAAVVTTPIVLFPTDKDLYGIAQSDYLMAVGPFGTILRSSRTGYSISGSIFDSSILPIAGVEVNLFDMGGKLIAGAVTPESGYYRIAGVSPGEYRITFTKAGYRFDPSSSVVTVTDSNVEHPDIMGIYPYTGTAIWPTFRGERSRSGASDYYGPEGLIPLWHADTGHDDAWQSSIPLRSSPAIDARGMIVIGSTQGILHCLDPLGRVKWRYPADDVDGSIGAIVSSPSIGPDGSVYVGSQNGLYAFRPDGTLKWHFDLAQGAIDSSPVIGPSGTIYAGSADGHLYAVNPNGTLRWMYPAQGESETMGAVASSPAVGGDGTVYVGSQDGFLYAVTSEGSRSWRFQTGGAVDSSPAVGSDGTVYVGSADCNIYAINCSDGSLKWEYATGGAVTASPALGTDGTVYIGSTGLYALGTGGGLLWRYEGEGASFSSSVVDASGVIYVSGDDGTLYGFNSSGNVLWSRPAGNCVATSPAIGANGMIYAVSDDGTVQAFARNYTESDAALLAALFMKHSENRETARQFLQLLAAAYGFDRLAIPDVSTEREAYTQWIEDFRYHLACRRAPDGLQVVLQRILPSLSTYIQTITSAYGEDLSGGGEGPELMIQLTARTDRKPTSVEWSLFVKTPTIEEPSLLLVVDPVMGGVEGDVGALYGIVNLVSVGMGLYEKYSELTMALENRDINGVLEYSLSLVAEEGMEFLSSAIGLGTLFSDAYMHFFNRWQAIKNADPSPGAVVQVEGLSDDFTETNRYISQVDEGDHVLIDVSSEEVKILKLEETVAFLESLGEAFDMFGLICDSMDLGGLIYEQATDPEVPVFLNYTLWAVSLQVTGGVVALAGVTAPIGIGLAVLGTGIDYFGGRIYEIQADRARKINLLNNLALTMETLISQREILTSMDMGWADRLAAKSLESGAACEHLLNALAPSEMDSTAARALKASAYAESFKKHLADRIDYYHYLNQKAANFKGIVQTAIDLIELALIHALDYSGIDNEGVPFTLRAHMWGFEATPLVENIGDAEYIFHALPRNGTVGRRFMVEDGVLAHEWWDEGPLEILEDSNWLTFPEDIGLDADRLWDRPATGKKACLNRWPFYPVSEGAVFGDDEEIIVPVIDRTPGGTDWVAYYGITPAEGVDPSRGQIHLGGDAMGDYLQSLLIVNNEATGAPLQKIHYKYVLDKGTSIAHAFDLDSWRYSDAWVSAFNVKVQDAVTAIQSVQAHYESMKFIQTAKRGYYRPEIPPLPYERGRYLLPSPITWFQCDLDHLEGGPTTTALEGWQEVYASGMSVPVDIPFARTVYVYWNARNADPSGEIRLYFGDGSTCSVQIANNSTIRHYSAAGSSDWLGEGAGGGLPYPPPAGAHAEPCLIYRYFDEGLPYWHRIDLLIIDIPEAQQGGQLKRIDFDPADGSTLRIFDIAVYAEETVPALSSYPPGDLNGDWICDLADAVQALQLLSQTKSGIELFAYGNSGADIDGDGTVSLPEAIYILQLAGGIRP